jgi:hypothetical protein
MALQSTVDLLWATPPPKNSEEAPDQNLQSAVELLQTISSLLPPSQP